MESNTWCPRLTAWIILSGSAVHVKGFGTRPLESNTTGANNIGVGFRALGKNITGTNNIGIGTDAARFNLSATSTVAIGYSAAATETIDYAATDNAGNTATSTRNGDCRIPRHRRTCTHALIILQTRSYHGLFA